MGSMSCEEKFVLAFEKLVHVSGDKNGFQNQAIAVADFVKYYVQLLFGLNENGWQKLMRQHRELHQKAEAAERRGRSPFYLLERQIEKKDELGRVIERYANHLGSLDCILDVRATAALVHHIITLPMAETLPKSILGCEMGAGTGVLSVAGAVPFLARGKEISIHTFEQSAVPCEDAQRIIDVLEKKSWYKEMLTITVHQDDITSIAPYEMMAENIQRNGPLGLWISETFGYKSKKPKIATDFECRFEHPTDIVPYSAEEETTYDPFPSVLKLSVKYFNMFIKNIAKQQIAAFPDIVSPRVIIDGKNSKMKTADGIWRTLSTIGEPYSLLPACIPSRWYLSEDIQVAARKTVDSRKKKKKRKFYTR